MRLGIIGTGRIAKRFVEDSIRVNDVEITCVYNPRIDGAKSFVKEKKECLCKDVFATDSLKELWENVDAVYIATPHEYHFQYAKEALSNDKHVLCEKPMSLKCSDVEKLYNLARKNNLVLREAIKTSYCEGFNQILEVIKRRDIGDIIDVEACFTRITNTNTREYLNENYGGSMTELGSYVMLPIFKIFGTDFCDIDYKSIISANGVDEYTRISMTFENGFATGKVGIGAKSEGQLLISGTKGYILAKSPWWLTKHFEVRYEDPNRIEEYNCEFESSGLQYELGAFVAQINDDISNQEAWYNEIGVSANESIAMSKVMEDFLDKNHSYRRKSTEKEKSNVKIWAHRGCSFEFPENTLESFEAAAKLKGLTGIELDVQFTKDGEIVVFHDENVSRVTNGDKNVVDYTLKELKELKVKPGTEKETKIPTFEEVLQLLEPYCKKSGLLINVEFKTSVIRYEGIEEKTFNLIDKYGLKDYVIYSSFLPDSVKLIKEIYKDAKIGMLSLEISDCMNFGELVNADALHPSDMGLHGEINDIWKNRPVRMWSTSEPFYEDGRVLGKIDHRNYCVFGVTDIFTNVPEKYLVN